GKAHCQRIAQGVSRVGGYNQNLAAGIGGLKGGCRGARCLAYAALAAKEKILQPSRLLSGRAGRPVTLDGLPGPLSGDWSFNRNRRHFATARNGQLGGSARF